MRGIYFPYLHSLDRSSKQKKQCAQDRAYIFLFKSAPIVCCKSIYTHSSGAQGARGRMEFAFLSHLLGKKCGGNTHKHIPQEWRKEGEWVQERTSSRVNMSDGIMQ